MQIGMTIETITLKTIPFPSKALEFLKFSKSSHRDCLSKTTETTFKTHMKFNQPQSYKILPFQALNPSTCSKLPSTKKKQIGVNSTRSQPSESAQAWPSAPIPKIRLVPKTSNSRRKMHMPFFPSLKKNLKLW